MVLFLYIALICYIPLIDNFIPKTDFGPGIPDIDLFRIWSFFLFLFLVIHAVVKKDVKLMNRWIGIISFFYLFVIVSISWSAYSYSLFILQKLFNSLFIPFLLVVVAMNLFERESAANAYIKHVVNAAFIMSVVSVFQMVSGFMAGLSDFRAAGTFGNPNVLAVILVLTIPCILYAVERNIISAVFGKIVSISVIIGIVSTVSRKGIVTMVVCYLLYNVLRKNYRKVITVFIGFAILGALVSGYSVVTKRFEKEEFIYHMNEKWEMVQAGVRMFKTNPAIGLGFNGYYENFSRFFTNPHKDKYSAHNIYITALANYGLIGFVPFLAIFIYPLWISIRTLRRSNKLIDNKHLQDMAVLCLSTSIPFMINGWFAGGLFYLPLPMSFFFGSMSLFLAAKPTKTDIVKQ